MTKRTTALGLLLLAALAAGGCARSGDDSGSFAKNAAQGGTAEVQLGRLAATRASSPAVRQFGQQMVEDHSKAGNELTQLAARKNIQLPTELKAEHKALMDKLSQLSGADFDKAYVDAMVDDHEHDAEEFQAQSNGGSDPDVKAFAAKTLPVIQHHLQMIKDIKAKM